MNTEEKPPPQPLPPMCGTAECHAEDGPQCEPSSDDQEEDADGS